MQLPFTVEQFYQVFRTYNEAVWPMQLVLQALALAAICFVAMSRGWSGRAVSGILALFWGWMALAYHLAFFVHINPLAWAFAAVSLAGALVFLWQGVICNRLQFRFKGSARPRLGGALILFALVLYPAWSWYAGHRYPTMPTFGLPCPTTLFTIGMLALLIRPYPRSVLVVPLLWCLVGAQGAFLLGVPQDLGLVAAAMVAVMLMISNSRPASRSRG